MIFTSIDSKYSYLAESIELSVGDPNNKELQDKADQARTKLITAYIPLAKHLAKKYVGRISRDEAESAAMLGLCQAIRSWIPSKGNLASWIRLYVKNQLLKELDYHSNLIKIPQAIAPKYKLVKFYQKQNLTDDDIIKKVNITMDEYKSINNIPFADTYEYTEYYDIPLKDEDIAIDFSMLSDVEKDILLSIHGYDHVMSYKELASKYNTSVGKIKFVEAIAMNKVKANQVSLDPNQSH